jgi:DNA repair photolyase
MDLRTELLALVAPAAIGDEVVPGARLVGASTELGLRLSFDVGDRVIHVEIAPVTPGARHAARTERLLLSYRSGDGEHHVPAERGLALCRDVAAAMRANEAAVLARIEAAAAAAVETRDGDARIRDVRVSRLLEPAGTPAHPYYTLSPYVGCSIGCRFCYAQSPLSTVRRIEGAPDVAWGSYVDVRVNAPEVLARELHDIEPRPIKFCPIVSDPYQAVETRRRVTRACLETFRDAGWSGAVMVLTRSKLIERDVDLLAELPLPYAGISIPTADADVLRHFEPRAASVDERLAVLSQLRAAGVRTFAVVQPMLPGDTGALADALAERVASVSLDVLRGIEGAAREFSDERYAAATGDAWQRDRALALRDALVARGVAVWDSELPPGV